MPDQLTVTLVPLADLQPDPLNPRNNTSAIEKVASSIRKYGFLVPLVVNAERKIVAGHTRYMAARMLGLESVPTVSVGDLTPEQQAEFSVAENRTSDFAFFDLGKLAEMGLSDEFVAEFDMDALLADLDDDDQFEVAVPKEAEKRAGLDLAPFEKYQYVTILCRSTYDYTNLLEMLGLEDLQSRYVDGYLKRGSSIGRVIEFAEFVQKVHP